MCIEKMNVEGRWVPIDATDTQVSVIQAPGATWIRNLRVTMNGRETYNSNSLFAYKTYIDMELSYSRAVKESFLGICGYIPGRPWNYDQNNHTDQGYQDRKALFKNGRTAQFYSKLEINFTANPPRVQPSSTRTYSPPTSISSTRCRWRWRSTPTPPPSC
jgi:hypothetical protein